jgi:hypothetical protein
MGQLVYTDPLSGRISDVLNRCLLIAGLGFISGCSPTELRNDMRGGLHEIPRGTSIQSVVPIDSCSSADTWCLLWAQGNNKDIIQLESGTRTGKKSVRYRTIDSVTLPRITGSDVILLGSRSYAALDNDASKSKIVLLGRVDSLHEVVYASLKIAADCEHGKLTQGPVDPSTPFCGFTLPSAYIR